VSRHVQGEARRVRLPDGRELFAQELPGPAPTVVFEAGAAAGRSTWALVQPAVGESAHAVVYDRAGIGRSEPDPVSRSLRRMADDLGHLLDALGDGPFVLVGHSAGGPIVRLAAADRLDRIAGLVLVDPTDEASEVLFGKAFRRLDRIVPRVNVALAHARLLRPMYRWQLAALPPDARADMAAEGFTPQVMRTHAAQTRTYLDELYAFREAPPRLDGLPVTVVSGALTGAGMSAATRADANAAHAQRATRHVIAERSGHHVPITEPEVIIDEIRRFLP
jgi:pimeloyl-ACP methyl ester carboxylesterase